MADYPFVGRNSELQQLQHFLDNASAGQSQVIFVAGEAGAGKTALLNEFVRRSQEKQKKLVAAAGQCNAQTGAGDAYLPFREVLTTLSGADDEKETAHKVSPTNTVRLKEFVRVSSQTLLDVGPDLIGIFVPGASLIAKLATSAAKQAKLADKFAERIGKTAQPVVNPNLDQEKIFQQYEKVLRELAKDTTLILILDDLHWADSGSLNLLFHLGRSLQDSRVLMVGTFRPDEVALGRPSASSKQVERHPFERILNELKRYRGDIVIDLGKASANEGREFVDALIDSEPNRLDGAFRQELFAHTDGHPLFTVEMLRNMRERGDLVKDADGKWILDAALDWDALPARVEGVIAERIARLTDDPSGLGASLRDTLNIGSVVGFDFSAQLVARVKKAQERELLKQLSRELDKRHGLVHEAGEIRAGKHFLSRYRFAHALFQQFLYNELSTGERRMLHGDVAQALEGLYEGHTEEILVQLAGHYAAAGDDVRFVEYAVRAGDASASVYAADQARFYYISALEILQRLTETPENLRARFDTMVKYAALALGAEDPRLLFARLLEAEALGMRLLGQNNRSDRLNLARLRYEIARMYFTLGEQLKAITYCDKIMDDAQAMGDEGWYALGDALESMIKACQGEFAQFLVRVLPAMRYLETIQDWREWVWMSMNYAFFLAEHGEYRQALELGMRVRQRADEAQDYWMICVTHLYHSFIYWAGGDMSQSLASARTMIQIAVEGNEFAIIQLATLPQMLAESRLGAHDAAARTLAHRQDLIEQHGVEIVYADWAAAARAEMKLNSGQPAEAIRLAEQAVKGAQSVSGKFAEGLAERTWAQALAISSPPQWDAAEVHFASSLKALEPGEAWLEAARTHVAWGRMLGQRGRMDAARGHFENAAVQFEKSGLTEELEETRALLHEVSA